MWNVRLIAMLELSKMSYAISRPKKRVHGLGLVGLPLNTSQSGKNLDVGTTRRRILLWSLPVTSKSLSCYSSIPDPSQFHPKILNQELVERCTVLLMVLNISFPSLLTDFRISKAGSGLIKSLIKPKWDNPNGFGKDCWEFVYKFKIVHGISSWT